MMRWPPWAGCLQICSRSKTTKFDNREVRVNRKLAKGCRQLLALVLGAFLSFILIGAAAGEAGVQNNGPSSVVVVPQEVRALPGHLDDVPMLNSNSPEVVQTEGILVSTMPPAGTATPSAHLNYSFKGRFDLFAHHIARADGTDLRTLYLGVILKNAQNRPVTVDVLSAASYLSQPDAPFIDMPPFLENADGSIYAGPGDRVASDILRGKIQTGWPVHFTIHPHSSYLLVCLPIPVKGLTPPLNGRSLLAKLKSSGPVYMSTAALYARLDADGTEHPPQLEDWCNVLRHGALAGPREKPPTPPGAQGGVAYGRVAGVQRGSRWESRVYDPQTDLRKPDSNRLAIPAAGQSLSFPISTVEKATFGTGQVQSAPLLVREPDTAFAAHGNYGVFYDLTFPLVNRNAEPATVTLALQTPLKRDKSESLSFYAQPTRRVFFRGTVKVSCSDNADTGVFWHVIEHEGEQGMPLGSVDLPCGAVANVHLQFVYPPDATPPQVVTIHTLGPDERRSNPAQ